MILHVYVLGVFPNKCAEDLDLDEKEILQLAIDNNIIDLNNLRAAVVDMKKKELLSQHKFAITQGKDGRWSTRVVLDDGTKAVRHRKTREELEQYLISFYKEKQEAKN